MTPFGRKIMEFCEARRKRRDDLAKALKLDPAKLTAIMNGFDGVPSPVMIFQIERELQLTRFELEELKSAARISNPAVVLSTAGLEQDAVEFANLLSQNLSRLPSRSIAELLSVLKKTLKKL